MHHTFKPWFLVIIHFSYYSTSLPIFPVSRILSSKHTVHEWHLLFLCTRGADGALWEISLINTENNHKTEIGLRCRVFFFLSGPCPLIIQCLLLSIHQSLSRFHFKLCIVLHSREATHVYKHTLWFVWIYIVKRKIWHYYFICCVLQSYWLSEANIDTQLVFLARTHTLSFPKIRSTHFPSPVTPTSTPQPIPSPSKAQPSITQHHYLQVSPRHVLYTCDVRDRCN